MQTELIVVGAGPAGLAAAAAGIASGLEVVVVDERLGPGGRVTGPLGRSAADPEAAWIVPPLAAGPDETRRIERLAESARDATFVFDALAWGIFPGFTVAVAHEGRTRRIDAGQVVLATGRHVVRSPFPGHHLAGVLTPIGLHHALEAGAFDGTHQLAVLGDGPLADAIADSIEARAGATVRRVRGPGRGSGAPDAYGADTLQVARDGQRLRIEAAFDVSDPFVVDAVVVADTQGPASELSQLAGCEHRFEGYGRGFGPVAGATGGSTVPGVFLAGSLLGPAEPEDIERSGTLAGLAAAVRAGRGDPDRLLAVSTEARRVTDAGPALVPPAYRELGADDATVACRCIGTTCGEVAAAIQAGARSVDDVKRHAKAGMGMCQGRECHRAVVRLLDRLGDVDVGTLQPMRARPPVRPVTAREMFAGEPQA